MRLPSPLSTMPCKIAAKEWCRFTGARTRALGEGHYSRAASFLLSPFTLRTSHICIPLSPSDSPPRIWIIQQALHTRQNRHDIIRRTPPILQDIQTQLSIIVYVWMEHFRYEFDLWRTVWVGFFERHDETECTACERCIGYAIRLRHA
jgi:hypothetical protein